MVRWNRAISALALLVSTVVLMATGQSRFQNQTGKPPVVQPRLIHLAKPNCDSGRTCHGLHGLVVLKVDVLADGTAGEVETVDPRPDERLVDAATAAAKQCRFEPGTFNGKPTSMNVVLKYKF